MTQLIDNTIKPTNKISRAWAPFAHKLAATLEKLEEDQYLILSTKNSDRFIQFAAQGSFGIRIETASNSYLDGPEQLYEEQVATLIDAGWERPSGAPAESTPEGDPDGSPNFFVDFPAPVSFESVANLTVRTLSEILRVPHPGSLQYLAFDDDNQAIALPELGLKLEIRTDEAADASKLLLDTLREYTDISDLNYDEDGDIGILSGSALTFIRLINDSKHIRLFSIILTNVDDDADIYKHINDINADEELIRFFYKEEAIFGLLDIFAAPYIGEHVVQAFEYFSTTVDRIGIQLQETFGGHTSVIEAQPSTPKH